MKFLSVYEARQRRLIREKDKFKTTKEMAEKIDIDSSLLSRYIKGRAKIGDDMARKIEKTLGMNEFEMDQQLIVNDIESMLKEIANRIGLTLSKKDIDNMF
ncbi:helix-turn-helix transcriptional regulator [Vibrio parahaemolyticus]|nr:XRE family transcriptional regulator [Vibrio parahaemolyticus]EGR3062773.1 XRE family transcriptional regulator [Vibrio parahaemolyticus]EGR3072553.1 XRE family transcriptional regulator [Vibrio parahaemolyticus]EGR3174412.1 XRE family transcriptional regulator [Vibrio parahaemolyticus]EJC6906637.1 helix-turn-helix transcriptional regulator [Vibrio parahaemolyticus]